MDQSGIDQIRICSERGSAQLLQEGNRAGQMIQQSLRGGSRTELGAGQGMRGMKMGPFPEHCTKSSSSPDTGGDESPGREGALWRGQWLWH